MALKHKSLFKQNISKLTPKDIRYLTRPSQAKPLDKFKLKVVSDWGRTTLLASLERISKEPRKSA